VIIFKPRSESVRITKFTNYCHYLLNKLNIEMFRRKRSWLYLWYSQGYSIRTL